MNEYDKLVRNRLILKRRIINHCISTNVQHIKTRENKYLNEENSKKNDTRVTFFQ